MATISYVWMSPSLSSGYNQANACTEFRMFYRSFHSTKFGEVAMRELFKQLLFYSIFPFICFICVCMCVVDILYLKLYMSTQVVKTWQLKSHECVCVMFNLPCNLETMKNYHFNRQTLWKCYKLWTAYGSLCEHQLIVVEAKSFCNNISNWNSENIIIYIASQW